MSETTSTLSDMMHKVLKFDSKYRKEDYTILAQEIENTINEEPLIKKNTCYNNNIHSNAFDYACGKIHTLDMKCMDRYDPMLKECIEQILNIILKEDDFDHANPFHQKHSYKYFLKYFGIFNKSYSENYSKHKILADKYIDDLNKITNCAFSVQLTYDYHTKKTTHHVNYDINKIQPGSIARSNTIIFLQKAKFS